jgi:hypothetical protein
MNPDAGIISWEQADQIMQDQRAEIARLRLTDAEREVIACAAESYSDNDDDEDCARVARTLRGLLERTGGRNG